MFKKKRKKKKADIFFYIRIENSREKYAKQTSWSRFGKILLNHLIYKWLTFITLHIFTRVWIDLRKER